MKTVVELRDQSAEELELQLEEARRKLFELRSEKATLAKLEQPHLVRITRRSIARIMTVLKEKTKVEVSHG